ncbi:DUF1684 domain-containing protein [Brachybacterium hainanense]|uniref:DUF1684 domain-containing protein n=1 Tax=Brachybacterium hainanense TaxID=1541174 RepID=A0ABV6RAN6_9MICO
MSTTDDFARDWHAWHEAHEARRSDPLGFLAVTGLFWLGPEPLDLPGAPGVWRLGAHGPEVDLAPGEQLVLGEKVLSGRHAFGPITSGAGIAVAFGDGEVQGSVEIADRGGRIILRPRRSDAPYLVAYEGTPAYPADARWRVPARFIAQEAPRSATVGSVVDGLEHVFSSPGSLEFEIDGALHRLTAFAAGDQGALQVLFRDGTSGVTTYAASRSLAVPAPDEDGATVLDFNRAVNLPCAYTDHATCPLPPAENRLPVAVEAGEQVPASRA